MTIEADTFFKVFKHGFNLEDWLSTMNETYRDRTERYAKKISQIVPEYKEKIKVDARYKVHILALVEDHCWDCQFYTPMLSKLVEKVENVSLSLLRPTDDVVVKHKFHETTNGGLKTPFVLFYSMDGYYIDRWVERPTIVYKLYGELRQEFGWEGKEFNIAYRKKFLKNQETYYQAAAEELVQKINRASAIQSTSRRINTQVLKAVSTSK